MLPSAAPATGGSTPTGGGDLFGSGATPEPGTTDTTSVGTTAPTSAPYSIFGGDGATAKPRIPLSNPATSPLNLIGKIEGWGIGPATKVVEVSIKVSTATGAQLLALLKKLPEGMTFELNLEKEDD